MLRDAIIAQLGGSYLENKLRSHLLATCRIESDNSKVVIEIATFLINHHFGQLVTALDANCPIGDIVTDFNESVKVCLIIASGGKT